MIGLPLAVVVAGMIGMSMLISAAPKPEEKAAAPTAPAVEIVTATRIAMPLTVTTQAEIRAKTRATIAARVGGQLVFVDPALEPGLPIRAGQPLARIDPADYRLALDAARAERARAVEALQRARAEANLAEEDWRALGGESPPSDLALFRPQVASAEADVRGAEARAGTAELNLTRTDVIAPFDGRIVERHVNLGDAVAVGAPVATAISVDAVQARVPLTDDDLAALGISPGYIAVATAPAMSARVSAVIADKTHEWEGVLISVDPQVDSRTRLTYGLIEVADPFGARWSAPLTPGLFATVAIVTSAPETFVAIPRAAIRKGGAVYVVDADDRIVGRKVDPAMTDADTAYFRDGLAEGDRVVVSYLAAARDGLVVRDRDEPSDASGAEGAVVANQDEAETVAEKRANP